MQGPAVPPGGVWGEKRPRGGAGRTGAPHPWWPAGGGVRGGAGAVGAGGRRAGAREDVLVGAEEPLEIRVDGEPVAVTMRTPGHDEELALGFAVGQGLSPIGAERSEEH